MVNGYDDNSAPRTPRVGCSCWLLFAVICLAPSRNDEDFRGGPRPFAVIFLYITAKTAAAKQGDPRVVDTGADFLRSRLDDAFLTQRLDLPGVDAEPVLQYLGAVAAQ